MPCTAETRWVLAQWGQIGDHRALLPALLLEEKAATRWQWHLVQLQYDRIESQAKRRNVLPKFNVQTRLPHHKRAEWGPSCIRLMLQDLSASACLRCRSMETAVQHACNKVWNFWGCSRCSETTGSYAAGTRGHTHLYLSVFHPVSEFLTQIHAYTLSNLTMSCGLVPEVLIFYLENDIMRADHAGTQSLWVF